jgi:hypothetical protein
MTALQVAGTVLQIIGAAVTALGLLYAWDRASGRFDQWRDSVTSKLAGLRAQVTGRHKGSASVVIAPEAKAAGKVLPSPDWTLEDRLQRVEQTLAELPGRTKKEIGAVEAAIDEKLAELDATGKGFAVKDIYWALGGIGIGMLGTVLSLIAQL